MRCRSLRGRTAAAAKRLRLPSRSGRHTRHPSDENAPRPSIHSPLPLQPALLPTVTPPRTRPLPKTQSQSSPTARGPGMKRPQMTSSVPSQRQRRHPKAAMQASHPGRRSPPSLLTRPKHPNRAFPGLDDSYARSRAICPCDTDGVSAVHQLRCGTDDVPSPWGRPDSRLWREGPTD